MYKDIANYIYLLEKEKINNVFVKVLEFFEKKIDKKIFKYLKKHLEYYSKYHLECIMDINTILLFIILHYYSVWNNLKMGKNIYVIISNEEVNIFQTLEYKPSYKTLSKVKLFSINHSQYLFLFNLKREKQDIQNAYLYHWLYYASFSPLWIQRIQKYGGIVNENEKKIDFADMELEEAFYEEFNLEPDEQIKEIQEKSIGKIEYDENYNWSTFYHSFGKNGLVTNN
jgi:hypothetical protein